MADPFTLALIGAGTSIIGGGVQAYGALQKGAADQAMYNYQAGVAQLNQKIALQNASYAQEAGGSAAYQSGLKTAATIAQQKVDQSASGFDVAQAVQGLGKTVAGAGDEIFNRAIALQNLNNETEASEADAKYMIEAGRI